MSRASIVMLIGLAGCIFAPPAPEPQPRSAADRLPVLLVVEGTALDRDDIPEVASALSRRIGRPVRTAAEPALDEREERARLAATHGRLPNGGWAEPRCAAGRAAVHALRYDADAYYHLALDRRESSRPATSDERGAVSGMRRASTTVLNGLGVDSAGTVREAQLSGVLTVTTFGMTSETRRVPLAASAREVATVGRVALDPVTVVAEGIARLAPPAYPHWDTTARRELTAACRVTALAVYDARLRDRPGSRDVLARALGRGPVRRAPPRAPEPAPPVEPPVAAPAAPETRYSCRSLCEIHMVEMCNNDRDLWSRHKTLWESTPCGQRRAEPFLRDCYQRQWLSGTFDEACRVPCEGAADGRARLLHLLQAGGCVRATTL